MMKTFTEDQIAAAFDAAPPAIREAFASEENMAFTGGLGDKYRLHVDVAGEVGQTIVYLLLGLINPTEFLAELTAIGIGDVVARQIANDVNEKIFKPLRAKMQGGGVADTSTPEPRPMSVPQAPGMPPMPPTSVRSSSVYEAPRTHAMPPQNLPGAPVPQSVPAPMPTTQYVSSVPVPQPTIPPQNAPYASSVMPAQPFRVQPAQETVRPVPPTPLPQANAVAPKPFAAVPPAPPPPAPPQFAPAPLVKEYTVDPYHEPIEDKRNT